MQTHGAFKAPLACVFMEWLAKAVGSSSYMCMDKADGTAQFVN